MVTRVAFIAWFAIISGSLVVHAAAETSRVQEPSAPAYPLKVSENNRYLVDAKGVPFLMAGESPQALMVNVSEADAEMFFANRRAHGFNAVWINLLCRPGTGGRKDGSTFDGIVPFTTPDDLSTPNDAYFARCDRMIELAGRHGLLVILDPCETIDHAKVMAQNGPAKCRAFGRMLGQRYKRFDNLLWMSGNDFQWKNAEADAAARALAAGIRETDPRHLQTIELEPRVSGSLDDATQMAYVQALFQPRAWYDLVPDQKHQTVTDGYGTFDATTTDGNCFVMTSDYVTAARTPDGKLVMAYLPSRRTITVNLSRLSAPATARWYDPAHGAYQPAADAPLPTSGKRSFTPPGNNADGDGDWVLVIETAPPTGG